MRGEPARSSPRSPSSTRPCTPRTTAARGIGALLLLLIALCARPAQAAEATDPAADLQRARAEYSRALSQSDPAARHAAFTAAQGALRKLVAQSPRSPELLCDFANAAMMAQDTGVAVWGFRRALLLAPDSERARRNLALLRDRLPEWLPRERAGPLDSLLFWQRLLPVPLRHLVAACAFACLVLLLIPYGGAPVRPWRRGAGLLCAALWLLMLLPLVLPSGQRGGAVVREHGVVLRTADSLGAPPALQQPLPAGAEVVWLQERADWAQVQLASGLVGWLPGSTLLRIDDEEPR